LHRCVWHGSCAHRFGIDDGTGPLTIVFGGVQSVPGMAEGVRYTVNGTALADEEGIVWNPSTAPSSLIPHRSSLVNGHAGALDLVTPYRTAPALRRQSENDFEIGAMAVGVTGGDLGEPGDAAFIG
jgi:hypothetical protein